jgi:hypothetical protein
LGLKQEEVDHQQKIEELISNNVPCQLSKAEPPASPTEQKTSSSPEISNLNVCTTIESADSALGNLSEEN